MITFNKLQEYGRTFNGSTKMQDLRKDYGGYMDKKLRNKFKEVYPDMYQNLLKMKMRIIDKKTTVLSLQEMFHFIYPDKVNECLTCGKPTVWSGCVRRYQEFCSTKCADANPLIQQRREATNLKRYGVKDPNVLDHVKEKVVESFQRKYGVANISQSNDIKEKKRQTFQKNYGEDHWTKTEEGKKYQSENSKSHLPEVQRKTVKTNIERYGVAHPGARSTNSSMECTDKFGVKHLVQGYESRVIELLSSKNDVTNVLTDLALIPSIHYIHNGVEATYYPDILYYTKDSEYLVEVKSDWTLRKNFDKVVSKSCAATEYMNKRGGNFWLFHYTKKLVLHIVKNPMKDSDLRYLLDEK